MRQGPVRKRPRPNDDRDIDLCAESAGGVKNGGAFKTSSVPTRSVSLLNNATAKTTFCATTSFNLAALSKTDMEWQRKTAALQRQLVELANIYAQRTQENEQVLDAIEEMIAKHEVEVAAVAASVESHTEEHNEALAALKQREAEIFLEKQRAMEEFDTLREKGVQLERERERVQEEIVIHSDSLEQLQQALKTTREASAEEERKLNELLEKERVMQDVTYGLSGEVKEMVVELEQLRRATREAKQKAKEMEVLRRQLYAQCEELKGTIRVYCRVKGSSSSNNNNNSGDCVKRQDQEKESLPLVESLREASVSSRSTASLSTGAFCGSQTAAEGKFAAVERRKKKVQPEQQRAHHHGLFTFPHTGEEILRSLCVCQSRSNATSTGMQESRETFTYDRVFDGSATQADVYADVEPLVNCAIDGYRVCIFAYGQTGSGKTYSMEGDVLEEERYGITPRALCTIFRRQEELKADGWSYSLSCYFVEIYNDVIRDLQQEPSVYEPGGIAVSQPNYHVIKHNNELGSTSITNVVEKTISSFEDFKLYYKAAMRNRSTAKTQLNDRSSRSHCVFVLRIEGDNPTIRQRSHGTLCLVDLAGSERVNSAGTLQGQQFVETVNINRSLLDLGKCISALNNSGSVVPWRNCKLTYLLQNYLGAKGGKMLMLVTVSDREEHMAESLNSLRFASRVNQTVVGLSAKRVNNY